MWQSEQKEKDAFVSEWLRLSDAFKAAIAVFGHENTGKALQVAAQWPKDPYVMQRRAELIEAQGEDAFLPTKADAARSAWEMHETFRSPDDKVKALRLYAEIMGHIIKPDTKVKIGSGLVAVTMSATESKL